MIIYLVFLDDSIRKAFSSYEKAINWIENYESQLDIDPKFTGHWIRVVTVDEDEGL